MRKIKFPYDEQMLRTNYNYCIVIQNRIAYFEAKKKT